MKPSTLGLCLCTLMSMAATVLAQRPPDPKVEIYIPEGMEQVIRLDVRRDDNEPTITKYNINRICAPEVDKVFLVTLTVGPDNQVRQSKQRPEFLEHEAHIITSKVHEPASAAWGSMVDVRRYILVVERVETDKGVWVLDADDQVADLKAIVERGNSALPRAKFIKK
jgi:hypothetical protein